MSENNSNEINQLPLEFKLYFQGKHVGYEENFFNSDEDITENEIFHKDLNGKTGRIVYGFYIIHDEKRQYTGFKDKNGDKIYFGDKLRIPEDNIIFTVVLERGVIFAGRSGAPTGFEANSFQYMEKNGK